MDASSMFYIFLTTLIFNLRIVNTLINIEIFFLTCLLYIFTLIYPLYIANYTTGNMLALHPAISPLSTLSPWPLHVVALILSNRPFWRHIMKKINIFNNVFV